MALLICPSLSLVPECLTRRWVSGCVRARVLRAPFLSSGQWRAGLSGRQTPQELLGPGHKPVWDCPHHPVAQVEVETFQLCPFSPLGIGVSRL